MDLSEDAFTLKVPIGMERNPSHYRDLVQEFRRLAQAVTSYVANTEVFEVQEGEARTLYVFVRSTRSVNDVYSYTFTREDCEVNAPQEPTVRMNWMEACGHCMHAVQRMLRELAGERTEQAARASMAAARLTATAVEPLRRVSTPPPKGGT